MGIKCFGELKDFPPGYQRYFLTNNCRQWAMGKHDRIVYPAAASRIRVFNSA